MSIGEVVREEAALAGVDADVLPDGTTVLRVGQTAVASIATGDAAVEFRLDAAVAAAAQRTPDTAASERGPEWVRFSPEALDDYAIDRAVAWLASAARRLRGG